MSTLPWFPPTLFIIPVASYQCMPNEKNGIKGLKLKYWKRYYVCMYIHQQTQHVFIHV